MKNGMFTATKMRFKDIKHPKNASYRPYSKQQKYMNISGDQISERGLNVLLPKKYVLIELITYGSRCISFSKNYRVLVVNAPSLLIKQVE